MDKLMDTLTLNLPNAKFHLGDEPDAWQAWYDDNTSSWKDVSLPHDWSVGMPFSKDYSSGTGYLAGGIGWYRIHITPDKKWKGKHISINFDGIYKNSRVWCNSTYLGERPNGYISFSYDITHCFNPEADNIISVYVDRREVADSRWFTGSGITRKVTLTISENMYPVTNGIFFYTPKVSDTRASYVVENEIANNSSKARLVTVTNLLFSADKTLVSEAVSQVTIPAKNSMIVKNTGTVKKPKLWSPDEPNLYTLKTYISYKRSYLVDTKSVGIRSFTFDADRGFFLNNTPYKFKGVCLHHDGGCLGGAVLPQVWYRRLLKLKDMGCNAIRMSHNPHMPELYVLCDKLGFFVMDEAFDEWEGPKNKWWQGHNIYPPKNQGYYTNFPIWHKKDLTDMILRDRNHPSVIMWSIGNEIDYPNDPYYHPSFETMTGNNDANKPENEKIYNPQRPNAERLSVLCKQLCDIVKDTDYTHPVTLAAAFPELSAGLGFISPLDVVGYNYRENLYKSHHEQYPDKPLLGSENGHSLSNWKAVTDNEYISGQFLWTGIDYLGEAKGWPIHGSGAGLLTLAGFEKPGYYRRQSFWSKKPVIHLTTVRESQSCRTSWGETYNDPALCEFAPSTECWNYKPGEMIVVKCYTNLNQVELFLNRRSLGILKKDDTDDCILFTIPFAPGELMAKSVKGATVSHSIYTTYSTCQMHLVEYDTSGFYELDNNYDTLNNYETLYKHLHQIEVTMLDNNMHRVINDSTMVHVDIENGTLLGIENGDLSDVTEYTANYRRAYQGRLLIYAVRNQEDIPMKLKVTADILDDVEIII